LEQLLSNALKYTQTGEISIALEEGNRLTVKDTGIGIAPEDLPRVFEKGYTGLNGRLNKASSGLGLYLAKTAADRLTIPLTVTSQVGKGSCFELNLEGKILQKGRGEASK
ncbi:MAG: ATP-binding protein, partial [Oscillospiraceae bacterium]|nr:ATP-binding protein [Oscillospiraceae bacterium]